MQKRLFDGPFLLPLVYDGFILQNQLDIYPGSFQSYSKVYTKKFEEVNYANGLALSKLNSFEE